MRLNAFFIGLCLLISGYGYAADKTIIRIGAQASGTLDWELSALKDDPQYQAADFKVEIQHVANAEAGKIALQSGAVDIIVSDWIWVSSLRATGSDFTFYPYLGISGALVVPENSPIHAIKDLKGKRLGIAGGELDKNWLLLQALAQKEQFDLNASVEKAFAAPPLINEQIKQQRVDAVLNYWHFAARLEALGYRQVIDGKGILKGLGVQESIPNLGFVFKQSWASANSSALTSFFDAGKRAKNRLCSSDSAWQKIIPLTGAEDQPTQAKLRERYCEGSVEHWGEAEQQAAGRVYDIIRSLGNNRLTGSSEHIQPGTFWSQK